LVNQGWKDSMDSVFHAQGEDPRGPIALVEVQGYVYAALHAMANIAKRRGYAAASIDWRRRAERLRGAVERRYWMEDQRFYGLALDGEDKLCRVRSSNAGHLLYTGLPTAARAEKVTEQLLSPAFNSGWGVRTLPMGEARYNP